MNIRFYENFAKRKNSTKIPGAGVPFHDIECKLKEDTDIENPSIILSGRFGTYTRSGNSISISDAVAGTVRDLTVDMLPIQAGSGTPSPDNPRPISGRNSLDITVNGNTETVNFGGTVYGGTCDVVNGGTSDKWAYHEFDGTEDNWQYYSIAQGSLFRITLNDKPYDKEMTDIQTYCNKYKAVLQANRSNGTVTSYVNTYVVDFIDNRFANIDEWKAYLFTNHLQIAYKKTTPTTINTPATPISLNKGNNTLSTSGKNMTITYDVLSPSGDLPFNYTYAYIPKFDKYYFMSMPIILTDGQIQYDLEEDYLASHKTEVGNTVAHIAYSSTGWDAYIVDNRLPVKTTVTTTHVSKLSGLDATGCYILSLITDKANGKTGAIGHYLMDESNLKNLVANLYDISIASVVAEAFYSPMDMIANCIWIPVSYADASALCSASELITLNTSPISTAGRPVYGCQVTVPIRIYSSVPIPIPNRSSDFRDSQPYTTASLYLPGIGLTDININDFSGSANVNVYTKVDITNGDIIYWIFNDNNDVVKTVSFNGAEPVPLAHIAANSKGALTGIGGAAAMIASAVLGAGNMGQMLTAGSLMAAGSTALAFNQRATSMKGGYSGRASFAETVYMLTVVRQNTADPNNANYIARWGRPVGQTHAISSHSGYVQCDAASVSLAGDNSERDIINNYLNTGFYYE